MANSYHTNPIILDTFTSEIKFSDIFGRFWYKLDYIKWQKPTAVNDVAVIKMDATNIIFDEVCVTAKQSIKENFNGKSFPDIIIDASGVTAGNKILVGLL